MGVRPGNERVDVRARARDRCLQAVGNELPEAVGEERPDEDLRTAKREGEQPPQVIARRRRTCLRTSAP